MVIDKIADMVAAEKRWNKPDPYLKLAPKGAKIFGIQILNSSANIEFCREIMQKLREKDGVVVELTVKGQDIGSQVLGGAQEYALFFV